MGRILQTVNLIVNAINPKQVTWRLNEYGTGYIAEEKEMENEFDSEFENPTTKKSEILFETLCTDSGIPWCRTEKDQKVDELKTFRAMQETLTSKLKIEKTIEKKYQTYIPSVNHSKFTREELEREKKADSETRKRLLELLEELNPKKPIENEAKINISSSVKCRFTRDELAREKKADLETRKRLQSFLENIKTKKEKDIATLFDPVQGEEYYLNRYNSEPAFKAWFDTSFQDYSIEQVLELAIPATFSKKPDLDYKNSDLQKYIDIYNNEPMYKDWFDRKYPGQSIYDVLGIPEPR
jgi:hypothetical protein